MEPDMTIRERDAFAGRCLLVLATARADDDRKTVRVVLDALAKAHGIAPAAPR
jgi:hypothetical protein